MAKNLVLAPILASLVQIWAPKFFYGLYLHYMSEIVASYHCTQFQGKLLHQTWENDRKPSFWPNFGPNLVPKNLFVGFTSTRCYALLQAIIVCNFKEN